MISAESRPRQAWHPNRLWSLWDMLQINPSGYLAFGSSLEAIKLRWWLFESAGVSGKQMPGADCDSPAELATATKETLENLSALASEFDLPVTKDMLQKELGKTDSGWERLSMFIEVAKSELKSKLFLFVPSHAAIYYEYDGMLSAKAKGAFNMSYGEIRVAGNCFALSLHTACVFHSMRAAEIGVRTLGKDLGVSFPFPIELADWHNVLDQIDGKISAMKNLPRGQAKDDDLRFYSTAAAQFRYFKDAWRVRVAHARATYGEDEAKKVLDHTRDFFESLSERLTEA